MFHDMARIEKRLRDEVREPTAAESNTIANYAHKASAIKLARVRPQGGGAYQRWGNKTVAQLMEELREDPELMSELADAMGGGR